MQVAQNWVSCPCRNHVFGGGPRSDTWTHEARITNRHLEMFGLEWMNGVWLCYLIISF